MNGLLITLGIVVVMSVLGYLTQALKRASDRRLQEQEREKQRQRRAAAAEAVANPTTQNELDRYIRAVEAQRARPVPTARPAVRGIPVAVPTVQPARKPRAVDTGTAFPEAKPRGPGTAPVVPDDLPMATVITPRGSVPVAAPVLKADKAGTLTASRSTRSVTPFGRQLSALLSSKNATALAVVLHEVLGPPKCRQAPAPPQMADPETGERPA